MSTEIVVGIITLIGVCITSLVTYLANRDNSRLEVSKFEEEKRRYREDKLEETILRSITALETSMDSKFDNKLNSLETKLNKRLDKNDDATKVSMKSSLRMMYNEFKEKDWDITGSELQHWNDDYKIYHDEMGGNGEIEALDKIIQRKYVKMLMCGKSSEDREGEKDKE